MGYSREWPASLAGAPRSPRKASASGCACLAGLLRRGARPRGCGAAAPLAPGTGSSGEPVDELLLDGRPLDLAAAMEVAGSHRATVARRAAYVAARLAPVLARGAVHSQVSCGPRYTQRTALKLRLALQDLGPAFVKLGQCLAAREDVLSEVVALELRKLCDAVPEFPAEEARGLLARELGARAPELPASPLAAASLGQVYRIRLDGADYALKVQRPGLRALLAVDMVILRGIAKFSRLLVRRLCAATMDPVDVIENWAKTMWAELDYMQEAQVMEDMRGKLCPVVPDLVIPRVLWRLTSSRVLATEWVHGIKVTDRPQCVTSDHISVGVEAYAAMIVDLGIVHADPHAGNLLITEPGGKVCLLDFGMVVEVPEHHRLVWAQCVVDLVRGNYPRVLDCLIGLGFFPPDCPREVILPVMSKIWAELVACGSDTKKRKDAVRTCFEEIKVLVRKFTFDVPDYYLALARALLTLEGVALTANCDFDIFEAAFPVALRAVGVGGAARGAAAATGALLAQPLSCRRRCAPVVAAVAGPFVGGVVAGASLAVAVQPALLSAAGP